MHIYTLHFDGSCGPKNPGGTAAYGYVLTKGTEEIKIHHAVLGTGPNMSNNVAEYAGLYEGLTAFSKHIGLERVVCWLNVYGDSRLVINQMSGKWGAKGGLYYRNYEMSRDLMRNLRKRGVRIDFEWIPREANQRCDDLSKAHNVTVT